TNRFIAKLRIIEPVGIELVARARVLPIEQFKGIAACPALLGRILDKGKHLGGVDLLQLALGNAIDSEAQPVSGNGVPGVHAFEKRGNGAGIRLRQPLPGGPAFGRAAALLGDDGNVEFRSRAAHKRDQEHAETTEPHSPPPFRSPSYHLAAPSYRPKTSA